MKGCLRSMLKQCFRVAGIKTSDNIHNPKFVSDIQLQLLPLALSSWFLGCFLLNHSAFAVSKNGSTST